MLGKKSDDTLMGVSLDDTNDDNEPGADSPSIQATRQRILQQISQLLLQDPKLTGRVDDVARRIESQLWEHANQDVKAYSNTLTLRQRMRVCAIIILVFVWYCRIDGTLVNIGTVQHLPHIDGGNDGGDTWSPATIVVYTSGNSRSIDQPLEDAGRLEDTCQEYSHLRPRCAAA